MSTEEEYHYWGTPISDDLPTQRGPQDAATTRSKPAHLQVKDMFVRLRSKSIRDSVVYLRGVQLASLLGRGSAFRCSNTSMVSSCRKSRTLKGAAAFMEPSPGASARDTTTRWALATAGRRPRSRALATSATPSCSTWSSSWTRMSWRSTRKSRCR